MCRTASRHCRHDHTRDQLDLENAKRRTSRNRKKAEKARAAGDLDKAKKSDALVEASSAEVTRLIEVTGHPDDPTPPRTPEATPQPSSPADTRAESEGDSAADPVDPDQDDTGDKRKRSSSGGGGGGGGKSNIPFYVTPGPTGFIGMFFQHQRMKQLHAALTEEGIEHHFEGSYVHIPVSGWNEGVHAALLKNGVDSLPVTYSSDMLFTLSSSVYHVS